MSLKFKGSRLALAMAAGMLLPAMPAHAGGTITFGEDKSVSIGLGLRGSFSSVENGAPNGTSNSQDFSLDSARIYLSGSLNKYIKGML
ncbi:MAG: porin, partial [Proteobacteria bacterium]|nr:porin [Pseudomonadota bacterium]